MEQVFADLNLARRLELAEGRANASFVEARAAVSPQTGAEWIEIGGAYAMFDGPESPCTQTFGLGMREDVTDDQLEKLESFFDRHSAPVFHEVCPLGDLSTPHLLSMRGYEPFEFTSILFLPLVNQPSGCASERIRVREIDPDEREQWAQLVARGWSEYPELTGVILDLARVTAYRSDGSDFVAELDGRPIATASVSIVDGVVLLAGASTIPEARKLGAQNALLSARLQYGAEAGCDIAMMGALPGSSSQRNAERNGFRIAYTRMKWRKRL